MFGFIKKLFASKPLPEKMSFVKEEKEYVYIGDGMMEEVVKPKETGYERNMRLIKEARAARTIQAKPSANAKPLSSSSLKSRLQERRSATSNTNTYVDDTQAYVAAAYYSSPSFSSSDSYSSCDSSSSFSGSCD